MELTVPVEVQDQASYEKWRVTGEVPKAAEKPEGEKPPDAGKTEPVSSDKQEDPETDEAAADGDQDGGEKPKKLGGFQRKLAAKDAELAEQAKAIAARDAELVQARMRIAEFEAKQPKTEQPAGPPVEPEWDYALSDTDNQARIRAWSKANGEWLVQEDRRQREEQAREDAASKKLADAMAKSSQVHADFHDKLRASENIPVSREMREFLLHEAEEPGELAYWLATNQVKAAEIATMSPTKAMATLARLDAKLASEAGERKAPPQASDKPPLPDPIKPIKASASLVEKSPSEMTQREYEEWRARTGRKNT